MGELYRNVTENRMNEYLREYEFLKEGIPSVKVCQCPEGIYGHGSTVWDAALVLCAFLETPHGNEFIREAKCIELGAGTGIVSIAACLLGAANSLATDLDTCVPFIRQNIGLNPKAETCQAKALDWNCIADSHEIGEGQFDWVLCADCVYDLDHVDSLTRTIVALKPNRGIIVSNERREIESNALAEKTFIKAMYEAGFLGKAVQKDLIRPEWRCEDIDVIVFSKPVLSDRRGA